MNATNYAVAPGDYLEEWIDDQGFSQQKAADLLGCSRKQVNEIINGHAPITSETALRLERVVGIPAATWLKYEAMYRSDLARIADEENLAQFAARIAPAAASYLRRIGATKGNMRTPGKLVSDFLAFHRCGTWKSYEQLHAELHKGDFALATLKDSSTELDQTLFSTWLRAAEMAKPYELGRSYEYAPRKLRAIIPELRTRVAQPDSSMLNDIARMLSEVGVVFMVVDPPKGLPLQGATRWIDKRVPVIQQTGRWGMDGFAIWTLFHELGHILNDPRGQTHLEYSTEKQRGTATEKSANEFAKNVLFGAEGLAPFHGMTNDAQIATKAREMGIAPGVAVHQMHRRRMLDYKYGNSLFVNLDGTFTA
ncbi:HigA family addiction module antitoxin [Arthrobacter sp. NIO-1057]|uniref:HigA family addiction module antitoxin n=1 Tax=Arthrobacter sp. NIO-1057 TaxID=993071 RepID=UPI00071DECD0|nr:HigA family addiction module antitoxin [Arthrobacter sp. NIO-1057]KSU65672.1 HigA family addiction module antidote protein [Arthrobacter sp. NIO-1057]SCC40442.1 addiction module antidote protein, HigA family [Arthrobacter sp. NIO-1057]